MAVKANRQAIDLFEAAGPVGEEGPPCDVRAGFDEVVLPRGSVLLARHVGERVKAVFRPDLNFIYRFVGGIPLFMAEGPVARGIAVRWAIQSEESASSRCAENCST